MGGALEQESQACVTAQLLVTSEFTVPVDGWNCAHIGATDPFGLCSLNKSAALRSKALLPLLLYSCPHAVTGNANTPCCWTQAPGNAY